MTIPGWMMTKLDEQAAYINERRTDLDKQRAEVVALLDGAIATSRETVARYTGPERRRYPRARKAMDAMTYHDRCRGQAMRELYERD